MIQTHNYDNTLHQSLDINENIVQQYPPLTLMETPTLMSTPIIDGNTKTRQFS
jgi:hypothetical protein